MVWSNLNALKVTEIRKTVDKMMKLDAINSISTACVEQHWGYPGTQSISTACVE